MVDMERKKILLVDDVRLFLNLEETFFRRTGCEIFTAQNGEDAIKTAKKEKPDLVLLDLILPGMNGDEVCRKIKSDPTLKNTKIIMVTTISDEETMDRCMKAGCDDYVTKPIHQPDLLGKAAGLLDIPYRVHFRILVKVEVRGEYDQGFFMGTSSDISNSGILVETDQKIELGEKVNLQFVVPGQSDTIQVVGKMARVDELSFRDRFGIGIHFDSLTPEQEQSIATFIKSRKPSN